MPSASLLEQIEVYSRHIVTVDRKVNRHETQRVRNIKVLTRSPPF